MLDKYIKLALEEAKKASRHGEVPVGAIIVKDNKIIAKAHNMVEKKKNAILHAEIIAIAKASKRLKNWRLNECEMYVTLEPCKMCTEAIKLSRIGKVYFTLKKDEKIVTNKSDFIFLKDYERQSLNIIQTFFKERR